MSELFRKAVSAWKAGREEEAVALYKSLLKSDPTNRAAWINLGALLSKKKDHTGAVACYRKALSLREDDTILFNLGSELFRMKDHSGAIRCLLRALEIRPDFFRAALLLGYIYESQEQYAQAAQFFQRALTLNPSSRIAALGLVVVLGEQDQNEEALRICEAFLRKQPDDTALRNLHAALLMKLGRYRESFEELKQVTSTDERYLSFEEHLKRARSERDQETAAFFEEVSDRLKERTERLRMRMEERKKRNQKAILKDDMKDLVDLSLLHLFSGDKNKALAFLLEARKIADQEKKGG
jgi:tetratricopeptide (TPR) repeat protein